MNIKKIFFVSIIIILIFASAAAAQRTLRFGMLESDGSIAVNAAKMFSDLVEEYTEGRIKIDVFPGGALGDTVEVIEMVSDGSVHMYRTGAAGFQEYYKDYRIFMMNWAFNDNDHVAKFLDSDRYQIIKDELEKSNNLRVLAAHGLRVPRHVLSKRPLLSIDDFQGLLMRVDAMPMQTWVWPAIGVETVQIVYGEAYMAVRQGIAEALEMPIDASYSMSFHEVTDYMVKTAHSWQPYVTVMNADLYYSLDQGDVDAIEKALEEAEAWYTKTASELENQQLKEMMRKEKFVVIEMDLLPFAEAMIPVAEELENRGWWSEGLFEFVRSLVD